MKLSVTPTRIEIVNEEQEDVTATVTMVDGACAKVALMSVVGWNDWLDLTDAVRRAMHMMGMHEEPPQQMSEPHGY